MTFGTTCLHNGIIRQKQTFIDIIDVHFTVCLTNQHVTVLKVFVGCTTFALLMLSIKHFTRFEGSNVSSHDGSTDEFSNVSLQ